jgi:copper transport protein
MLKIVRESADMPDVAIGSILFSSVWGWSLIAASVGSLLAGVAFWRAHSSSDSTRTRGWRLALVAAAVLAIAPALGGHAIGSDRGWLAVPADVIHLSAGSMWLGTLAVIVLVGIPAAFKAPDATRPGARVAAVINAFSPMALACGGVVVATGTIASLIHLPRLDSLWTTPYGIALCLKILFVLMLFGAGAWNWRRMKPRLTGDNSVAQLRSMASLELLLATVVLGLTAILVALELP